VLWCCGLVLLVYIMDRVVMNETIGLFCVDILVTLAIFPNEAMPRYALYIEEGFRLVYF